MRDWTEPGRAVADLLSGVDTLDRSGIAGSYVAVLDPEHFSVFWQAQASGCGYPASEQVKERIKDVYRSSVIRGGAVFSGRGGDFLITTWTRCSCSAWSRSRAGSSLRTRSAC